MLDNCSKKLEQPKEVPKQKLQEANNEQKAKYCRIYEVYKNMWCSYNATLCSFSLN